MSSGGLTVIARVSNLPQGLPQSSNVIQAATEAGGPVEYTKPVINSAALQDRLLRLQKEIRQTVAPGSTGKVTLYERPVPGLPSKVAAQHLYLVITTSSGQSITIEAGPSNQADALGTGVGSNVILQNYVGDNGTNISNAGVAVAVPNGDSFSQFANQLIDGANYFDLNNTNIYGGATSNSNSFMSGLLDWAGASSALTQMNGYNMVPVGPNTYTVPGEDQPFSPSEYGPP